RAGFTFHDYCLGAGAGGAFPPAPGSEQGCPVEEQLPFDNAEAQSGRTGDALLLGEWGATDDLGVLRRMVDRADLNRMSWLNWTYFNCCFPGPVAQSVIRDPRKPPTGDNVRQDKLDVLARPFPR